MLISIIRSPYGDHDFDPKILVRAERMDSGGTHCPEWVKVQGKEIKVALITPGVHLYNDDAPYFLYNFEGHKEYEVKRRDCVSISLQRKRWIPECDMTYVMTVQGIDETGYVMVKPEDCVKARLPSWFIKTYSSLFDEYVHLKPSDVYFHEVNY